MSRDPLPEPYRSAAIEANLAKAAELIAELKLIDPDKTPNFFLHAGYYSMFHAAQAVIIFKSGRAPKKHSALLSAFGNLLKNTEEGRRLGKSVKEASVGRIASDYGLGPFASPERARLALARADEFLDACRKLIGSP